MKHLLLAACAAMIAAPVSADTLVYNVDGITIDENGEVARFVSIVFDENGIITHTLRRGDDPPEGTDYALDGEGSVMLPGMIDSHVNIMDLGFTALTLDLSDAASLEEALVQISTFAQENAGRPWILGRGWNGRRWGVRELPTAADLDAIIADRPVWLQSAQGDAFWANSIAMDQAGITADTPDPAGGRIVRAPDGTPSGVFIGTASDLIETVVPPPRPEDRDLAFALGQRMLIENGITATADMGTRLIDWHTFRRAGDAQTLRIRIMAYADSVETMELIGGPGPTLWLYEDRLRLNGLSLSLDGSLASRAAQLGAPYSDAPQASGLARLSSAQLRNRMSRAALDNFQVAVRASGDAAISELLLAIEELSESYTGDRRWRIEHAAILAPEDTARLAQQGLIASMQPLQQVSDIGMIEARLGTERLEGAHAWRSILAAGGRLAFGSGAPAQTPDPFAGMAAAISRSDEDGQPFGGWYPQQTVSREAALAAFTSDAAYAGLADGRFGRLVPGERADFLLVDRDILLASPAAIRETGILAVWIAGERVFSQ